MGNRPLPARRPMGWRDDKVTVGEDDKVREFTFYSPLTGFWSAARNRRFTIFSLEESPQQKWQVHSLRKKKTKAAIPRRTPKRLLFHPQLLLDLAQLPAHIGQLFQRHQDALLLALRGGRRAEHALVGGHVLGHARLGPDLGAVADVDVAHDADLAGDHDVVARGAGAGHAHLADEQVVPADAAVVADLHQVVDLGPRADARG